MKAKFAADMPMLIALAATHPDGFRVADIPGYGEKRSRENVAAYAVTAGVLHKVRVSYRDVRYFGSAAAAQACEAKHCTYSGAARRPASTVAAWRPDAPVTYPTNPDGSPAYKYTVAPTPADPPYSNTHAS